MQRSATLYAVAFVTTFYLLACKKTDQLSDPASSLSPVRHFNAMAPLNLNTPGDWDAFQAHLTKAKAMHIESITTDVWWGKVESTKGAPKWDDYDKLASTITAGDTPDDANLKWIPILSFHACGGNAGDDDGPIQERCDIPLPQWIWDTHNGDALKYKSEKGNINPEAISVWGTPEVLEHYRDFMIAFRDKFQDYARNGKMPEVNISLGPAGELRYPSYSKVDGWVYSNRGYLQSFSNLAKSSFRAAMKKRYNGDIAQLNSAWNVSYLTFDEILSGPPDAEKIFANKNQPYGTDFFDWYRDSLIEHGRLLLTTAIEVFRANPAYDNTEIGAKIPGIHWRMNDGREAELAAGLISPSSNDLDPNSRPHQDLGGGYRKILKLWGDLNEKSATDPKVVLHFTCLEKNNHEDGGAASLAESLVFFVGAEAARQSIPIKGENALAGPLYGETSWKNMQNVLDYSSYEGITFLRIKDIVDNDRAKAFVCKNLKAGTCD
jgi:beta-amylase